MASDTSSIAGEQHHDGTEWDAQRENFRTCYLDQDMTLKQAAAYMTEHFGFFATPRQWERKVKGWGFTKYKTKDERLQEIADTGKSVYEVSQPGRRSRGPSSGNLAVEDRNLRRFARRHISRTRSRSRSRSASTGGQPRVSMPDDMNLTQVQSLPVLETTYDLDINASNFFNDDNAFAPDVMLKAHIAQPDSEQPIQLLVMQENQTSPPPPPDVYMTFDNTSGMQHLPSGLDGSEAFPVFGDAMTKQTMSPPLPQIEMLPPDGYLPDNSFSPPNITLTGIDQTSQSLTGLDLSQSDMTMFSNDFNISDMSFTTPQPNISQPDMSNFSSQYTDLYTNSGNMFPFQQNLIQQNSLSLDPLWRDISPLLNQYTQSVQQAIAQWTKADTVLVNGQNMEAELMRNIAGSEQSFTSHLAVALENYTRNQQRILQAVTEQCRKLRQKNALLENTIQTQEMQSQQILDLHAHRQSLPTSYRMPVYDPSGRPNVI